MSCVGCTFLVFHQSPALDNVPAIIGLDNQAVRQKAGGSLLDFRPVQFAPYKVGGILIGTWHRSNEVSYQFPAFCDAFHPAGKILLTYGVFLMVSLFGVQIMQVFPTFRAVGRLDAQELTPTKLAHCLVWL